MDTKEVLEKFLSKNPKVQRYHIIYKEKGYSIAGDGFWMVRVKEEIDGATDSGDLNLLKYFSYYNTQKKDFLATRENLEKTVKKNYSLTPDCTQCRGTGKLKNEESGKMGECDYCNGSGMDQYGVVRISDQSIVNFARLYRLASILDDEVYLSVSQKSQKEPIFFQKDKLEGILMPVMLNKNDEDEIIDLRSIE